MKNNPFKIDRNKKLLCILATIIYSLSLIYLYRQQANSNGVLYFHSDLPTHIATGVSGSKAYSLMCLILGFLFRLPYPGLVIAVCLTFFTLLSIFATLKLLKYLLPNISSVNLYLASLICNMYMPLFMPHFNDHAYVGLPSFTVYHNSTYKRTRKKHFKLFDFWIYSIS